MKMETLKGLNSSTDLTVIQNDQRLELINVPKANEEMTCSACTKKINNGYSLSWELMDFCDDNCLLKYQNCLSTKCSKCSANIEEVEFGKYFRRLKNCFALFCSKNCLLKYKSSVSICSFCETVKPKKDASSWSIVKLKISSTFDMFLFCSMSCYETFLYLTKNEISATTREGKCSVCEGNKPLKITLNYKGTDTFLCGKECLNIYTFHHENLSTGECSVCRKYYSSDILEENRVFQGNSKMLFCSTTCRKVFTFLDKKMMACDWCQIKCVFISMVKKYILDISSNTAQFCSLSCLKKHQNSTSTLRMCSVKLKKLVFNEDYVLENYANIPINRPTCGMELRDNTNVHTPKLAESMNMPERTLCKEVQANLISGAFIPIPVPIYVPVPMAMYSIPTPYPLPFPLPIPVPIFLPMSRSTMKGVSKEIEKYKNKICIDPCQADILQMADALVDNEKQLFSDSESNSIVDAEEIEETELPKNEEENYFDFEWALTDAVSDIKLIAEENREKLQDKKRKTSLDSNVENKKVKYEENVCETNDIDVYSKNQNYMRLDYTLGINAWKQWVSKHNTTNSMTFTSEILKMSPKEFSVALCHFVQELRKPNGNEYAPDTIYYLCLGIQYYLDQNGRYDNIFNDQIYDEFTDCLDALAIQFCALYDDESHFIVTRVEEEHLWETKQLGCYSPHVLLNTLIYFNTKYYCRSNVDEHLQLSFYHILKGGKTLKSTMLRYYPMSKNTRRKKVYEMFENNEDPLRCPVRLYEYYLSKCPEGVKNKYESMYLLPEKHCTSESPLWYSSESLPRRYLAKIVNRVKMVKEINVALLSFDN